VLVLAPLRGDWWCWLRWWWVLLLGNAEIDKFGEMAEIT